MRLRLLRVNLALMTLATAAPCCPSAWAQQPRTFVVDCRTSATAADGPFLLHSLTEVNALPLHTGDRVLFERGTSCRGSLQPHGEGFAIAATGSGPLPEIHAAPADEAALSMFNVEHVSISSLRLTGGTTYGLHLSGDRPHMRDIALRNLTVTGVRGKLLRKESGLIVVAPSATGASFAGLTLDDIRAYNTTQWAGIFVSGAVGVTVQHAIVHDVQGDGIVLFDSQDGRIAHSVAWHTGMQIKETIGTPNAIWTWHCSRCVVEDNEAFLTDSPGIDGGAFDIDWGNSFNTVSRNFGHDTQGYCVSVFGANGITTHSVVEQNLCLNNGMSPRLAQRQGAILLMTWNNGTIEGVTIQQNHIDWRTSGDTPAIQTGETLNAKGIELKGNEIHSTGTKFVSSTLAYAGSGNHYVMEEAAAPSLDAAKQWLANSSEEGSTVELAREPASWNAATTSPEGWRLRAHVCGEADEASVLQLFIDLDVAKVEFGSLGLKVELDAPPAAKGSAQDFGLEAEGIRLTQDDSCAGSDVTLEMLSPQGKTATRWDRPAAAIELGLALRAWFGRPGYGRLGFEPVAAKG